MPARSVVATPRNSRATNGGDVRRRSGQVSAPLQLRLGRLLELERAGDDVALDEISVCGDAGARRPRSDELHRSRLCAVAEQPLAFAEHDGKDEDIHLVDEIV